MHSEWERTMHSEFGGVRIHGYMGSVNLINFNLD